MELPKYFIKFNKVAEVLKKQKTERKGEKLTWRPAPGPPAGPAQHRASELLAGQAGRQVLDGEHCMGVTHLLAASPLHSPD